MRINVTRSSMPPFEEYCGEVRDLWDSHWLTNNGQKLRRLEGELKGYLGAEHVELFSNGHMALEAALAAMVDEGEVITTPYTFASTTHAIVRRGLIPVFADIRSDDLTLDPACVEKLITPRTRAIVPVHVYGNLCQVDAFAEIAKKHGLKLIYDAAHAFGTFRGGKSSACFGDASMFSFHATKVFNTIEGGAVCTADAELASRLALERNFGIEDEETVSCAGGNAKMNEFQAAMGLLNLKHLDISIAERKRVWERYMSHLDGTKGIRTLAIPAGERFNYAYMPVLIGGGRFTRDELYEHLKERDIYARKYFYPLITDFDCYRGRFEAHTPIAASAAAQVLTLPIYPELTNDEVDRICGAMLD